MVPAQKALYLKLTKCAADCLPSSWNQQWLRDCDLLSPSTLPRIPKETVKTKTNHLQLVDSLQQTVEDLKLKMCHISDDIQNWENIMQDNETYLYNPCEDHDVADCYYSGDLSDYSNDKWHPISFVCRPVSKKHKCRKIFKRQVRHTDIKHFKIQQHNRCVRYSDSLTEPATFTNKCSQQESIPFSSPPRGSARLNGQIECQKQ
jgi:hypothetical protein